MKTLYTVDEAYDVITLLSEACISLLDAIYCGGGDGRVIEKAKLALENAGTPYEE